MWSHDNTLTVVGYLGAIAVFFIGLWRYSVAQTWKRMEWVAATLQEFLGDPVVRNALQMIDWSERRVLLFPDDPDPARRYVRVDDTVVARALLPHQPGHRFSAVEAAIRDTFDQFLDRLALIHSFLREGLITRDQLKIYLEYWITRIGKPEENAGPAGRLRALHTYIRVYGFTEVEALLDTFKHKLQIQSKAELERLRSLDGEALIRALNDPNRLPAGAPAAVAAVAGGDAG